MRAITVAWKQTDWNVCYINLRISGYLLWFILLVRLEIELGKCWMNNQTKLLQNFECNSVWQRTQLYRPTQYDQSWNYVNKWSPLPSLGMVNTNAWWMPMSKPNSQCVAIAIRCAWYSSLEIAQRKRTFAEMTAGQVTTEDLRTPGDRAHHGMKKSWLDGGKAELPCC